MLPAYEILCDVLALAVMANDPAMMGAPERVAENVNRDLRDILRAIDPAMPAEEIPIKLQPAVIGAVAVKAMSIVKATPLSADPHRRMTVDEAMAQVDPRAGEAIIACTCRGRSRADKKQFPTENKVKIGPGSHCDQLLTLGLGLISTVRGVLHSIDERSTCGHPPLLESVDRLVSEVRMQARNSVQMMGGDFATIKDDIAKGQVPGEFAHVVTSIQREASAPEIAASNAFAALSSITDVPLQMPSPSQMAIAIENMYYNLDHLADKCGLNANALRDNAKRRHDAKLLPAAPEPPTAE